MSPVVADSQAPQEKPRGAIKHPELIPAGESSKKRLCLAFSQGRCKKAGDCAWGHDRVLTAAELKAVYAD
jgi:hypothetical protein